MAPGSPTEPVRPPDEVPTALFSQSGCRRGHDQPNNPTWHRTLGMVPALSSVVIGAVLVLAVLGVEVWVLPGLIPWTLLFLLAALVFSGIAQLWLGHRGTCWLRRTVRWWLGPIGTFIDPLEMG